MANCHPSILLLMSMTHSYSKRLETTCSMAFSAVFAMASGVSLCFSSMYFWPQICDENAAGTPVLLMGFSEGRLLQARRQRRFRSRRGFTPHVEDCLSTTKFPRTSVSISLAEKV
jgi:hypothetical protein